MNCKAVGMLLSGILCLLSPVSACLGPSNVEGVAFTDGEILNLESLSSLGTEGVNYKKVLSDNGGTTITYPSHYDSKVMAFVGNVGTSYQQGMMMNCFGIIYPLSEEMMNSHESVSKEVFHFAAGVKSELEWLVEHNIVTIEYIVIDSIFESLDKASNGGMQYWTLQKKSLGYNSWYTYDTLNQVWDSDGVNGVKGVYTVRGVNGCTGLQIPAFETFLPVSVKEKVFFSRDRVTISLSVSGKTITLKADQPLDISVVSINGSIVKKISTSDNVTHRVELNHVSPGTYLIRGTAAGVNFNRSVVLH